MANLILPRRFTQQPQYPVEIDLSRIKPPQVALVSPSHNSITRDKAAYPNALSYDFKEALGQYNDITIAGNLFTNGYTFIAVIAPTGTDSNYSNVFNAGSLVERRVQLRHDATTWYLYQKAGTSDWSVVTWPYSANTPTVIVGRWNGQTVYAYENGSLKGTPFNKGAFLTAIDHIRIGGDSGASNALVPGTYWQGGIGLFSLLAGDVGDTLARDLSINPWQIFHPRKQILYFDVGSGGVTGTIASTMDAFTSSITGTTTVVGTTAATMAAFTSAITGTSEISGTIAAVTEDAVGALEGTVGTDGPTGTITGLVEDSMASMAGSTSIVGTITVTLENFTQSAQGTTTVVGTIAVNLNDFTSAITGTTTVIGTSNITLDPFIMTANGYPGDAALIRIRTLVGAGE